MALSAVASVRELELQHRTYVLDLLLFALKEQNTPILSVNSAELAANNLNTSQIEDRNFGQENLSDLSEENVENKILQNIEKCKNEILLLYEMIENENKLVDKNEDDLRGIWLQNPSKINVNEELKKLQDEFDEKFNSLEMKYQSYSKQIRENCEKEKTINESNRRKYGKENLFYNSPLTKYLEEKLDEITDLDEFSLSEVILQENNSSNILCEKNIESDYNLFVSEKKEISLIVKLALFWSPDIDFKNLQDLLHQKIVTRMIHDSGENLKCFLMLRIII